jgi:hypothetical protein
MVILKFYYKGVALQYVIKNYLYVQNTKYLNENKIQKKFKHKNNLQQFF